MKIFCKMISLLFAVSLFIIAAGYSVAEEDHQVISYTCAEIIEDDYQITAALVVVDPLSDYLYVSVSVSYLNPVNYVMNSFHLYLNDQPAQELPFVGQSSTEQSVCFSFAGIFHLSESEITSLELVPVIETHNASGLEIEEMLSGAIGLENFKSQKSICLSN